MQMGRPDALTMSSLASLAAVTVSTRISGTTVVNQDREEICGITWGHTHTHGHTQTHTQCKENGHNNLWYTDPFYFEMSPSYAGQSVSCDNTTRGKICGFSFREDFIISMFRINHWDWYKAASSCSLDYSAAVSLVTALYLATLLLDGYRLLAVDEATSCAGCDTT